MRISDWSSDVCSSDLLPKQRQNLLFSATFSDEIRSLARGALNNPGEVSVTPRNTATELVTHTVHLVAQNNKRALISHIIRERGWHQVLVRSDERRVGKV